MSVVACRITPSGFEIASDSISVRNWTQRKGNHSTFSKLFETNGMIIGGVGDCAEIGFFQIYCKTHKPVSATPDDLINFISEFASWKNKKTEKYDVENSYIIGLEGKVFAVESWHVEEIKTYEAIGAGQDFALAALFMDASVEEAVNVAVELSVFCEAPINVIKWNKKNV